MTFNPMSRRTPVALPNCVVFEISRRMDAYISIAFIEPLKRDGNRLATGKLDRSERRQLDSVARVGSSNSKAREKSTTPEPLLKNRPVASKNSIFLDSFVMSSRGIEH